MAQIVLKQAPLIHGLRILEVAHLMALHEICIIIITDEGPALLRLFKRIITRLSISALLDERFCVVQIAVDGLDGCINTILLHV